MTLKVYRLLPVLCPQKEEPLRSAAVRGFRGSGSYSSTSPHDRKWPSTGEHHSSLGELEGAVVFIWVVSCYLKSGFVSENETAGATFGG